MQLSQNRSFYIDGLSLGRPFILEGTNTFEPSFSLGALLKSFRRWQFPFQLGWENTSYLILGVPSAASNCIKLAHIFLASFINLDRFHSRTSPNSIDYEKICNILDKAPVPEDRVLVADSTLTAELKYYPLQTLQIPILNEQLLIYTIATGKGALLEVDNNTKSAILKGLGGPIPGMTYPRFSINEHRAKRYAIPALSEYRSLAVNCVKYGFALPTDICTSWILAPFVREEIAIMQEQSKDRFIELATSSKTFPYIVEYTMQHAVDKSSKEQILTDYRKLIGDFYDVMA